MSFVFQDKQYLRFDEVALLFRVSTRSVRYWVQKGKLSVVTTPGGRRLIPSAKLFGASANYTFP